MNLVQWRNNLGLVNFSLHSNYESIPHFTLFNLRHAFKNRKAQEINKLHDLLLMHYIVIYCYYVHNGTTRHIHTETGKFPSGKLYICHHNVRIVFFQSPCSKINNSWIFMDRLKQTLGKCKVFTSVNSHCFQNYVTYLFSFCTK